MTESGNYVLAILKTKENYDSIRISLEDLRKEMEDLKEITVNEKKNNIEYFLGGDWKFLATVCGLPVQRTRNMPVSGASAQG